MSRPASHYGPSILRLTVVALAALAALASATAPKPHDVQKAMHTKADFDQSWSAVVEVFANRGWDIKNLEKDSGIITTDWMSLGRSSAFADCGGSGLASVLQREVRFNVFVRDSARGSSVTVNSTFRELRSLDSRRFYVDCNSTGQVEDLVHQETNDALRQRKRRAKRARKRAEKKAAKKAAKKASQLAPGTKGGPCYGNRTCNDGLSCDNELERCAAAPPAQAEPVGEAAATAVPVTTEPATAKPGTEAPTDAATDGER